MKTRLLRRLRRKAIKKIYAIPLEDNGIGIFNFDGCVFLRDEGRWTCDSDYAKRYYDEVECIESLKKVRRTYICELIAKKKLYNMCQKINR